MKILLTNDDGIESPGLWALHEALSRFATVTVVAPEREQSGKGVSISLGKTPLDVKKRPELNPSAWSVSGTPADCVKVAMSFVLQEHPDLIVSGINYGSNAGRNVLYSGTVGCVIEGVLRGIPGIAFSSVSDKNPHFHLFKDFVPSIIKNVVTLHPLPKGTLLNVTFPRSELLEERPIQGMKITRQGKQYCIEDLKILENHAHEKTSIHLGFCFKEFDEEEDSDIYWLDRGYITLTPIHVEELTDWRYYHEAQNRLSTIFENNPEEIQKTPSLA